MKIIFVRKYFSETVKITRNSLKVALNFVLLLQNKKQTENQFWQRIFENYMPYCFFKTVLKLVTKKLRNYSLLKLKWRVVMIEINLQISVDLQMFLRLRLW